MICALSSAKKKETTDKVELLQKIKLYYWIGMIINSVSRLKITIATL